MPLETLTDVESKKLKLQIELTPLRKKYHLTFHEIEDRYNKIHKYLDSNFPEKHPEWIKEFTMWKLRQYLEQKTEREKYERNVGRYST